MGSVKYFKNLPAMAEMLDSSHNSPPLNKAGTSFTPSSLDHTLRGLFAEETIQAYRAFVTTDRTPWVAEDGGDSSPRTPYPRVPVSTPDAPAMLQDRKVVHCLTKATTQSESRPQPETLSCAVE